jgi:flavin-dependent dehydrogenase
VTIAGGGLAGAASAIELARAGARVTLLERAAGPAHKICGEFLSREALGSLASLGIDLPALGAHPITHLRIARRRRTARVRLPFTAQSLTRRRLDEVLLETAMSAGVALHREHRFRPGDHTDGTLFLATGKHDAVGLARDRAGTDDGLVGFKMYFRLSPAQSAALAHHIELHLFPDGYAGLQLVEDGVANLCLLVERERAAQGWPSLLAELRAENPHLAERLDDAAPCLGRPLAIARTPFGYVHRPVPGERAFRLGDQAAVIPAFTGDGMSVALHSASLAARTHLAGGDAAAYHGWLHRDVAAQIGRATSLYRLSRHAAGQVALMGLATMMPAAVRTMTTLTRVRPTV